MRSDRERLLDILEAIGKIERYTQRGRTAFEEDELFQVWVVRHLQIIGEAATRISEETQTRFPEIPWKKRSVCVMFSFTDISISISISFGLLSSMI
jgi:uncharacterized protein with HEPN domain